MQLASLRTCISARTQNHALSLDTGACDSNQAASAADAAARRGEDTGQSGPTRPARPEPSGHLQAELVRRARGEGEGLVELGVEVVVHHLGLEGGPAAAHLHVRVGAVPEVGRLVLCDPDPVCRKVAVTGQCQGRGGSGLRGSPALRMFSALMTFTTTFRRRWDCPDFSFKLQNSSNEISPGK